MSLHESAQSSFDGESEEASFGSRELIIHEHERPTICFGKSEELPLSSVEHDARRVVRDDCFRRFHNGTAIALDEKAGRGRIGRTERHSFDDDLVVDRSGNGELWIEMDEKGQSIQLAQGDQRTRVAENGQGISRALPPVSLG
jgi:hypothetical protein